jgi:hypothetical protein
LNTINLQNQREFELAEEESSNPEMPRFNHVQTIQMKKNQQFRQGKVKKQDIKQPTNEDYVPKNIHPNQLLLAVQNTSNQSFLASTSPNKHVSNRKIISSVHSPSKPPV